jgi:hypothetical protein
MEHTNSVLIPTCAVAIILTVANATLTLNSCGPLAVVQNGKLAKHLAWCQGAEVLVLP